MNLDALPVIQLGATSILGFTVLMVFRGALIPRRVHEDRIRDKDDQITYYQTALERETSRSDELTAQVGVLMEVANTAEHVFNAIPLAAARPNGGVDEMASQ
jgi:hypothetical protein